MHERFDLLIIGGGEAGIEAALRGSELNAKVCLVEKKSDLGGTCADTGTLPSKVFINSSRILDTVKNIEKFGIKIDGNVSFDFKDIINSKNRTNRCEIGLFNKALKKSGVEVIHGSARLVEQNIVDVRSENVNVRKLEADKILIATGSKPLELHEFPADDNNILSTDDILSMEKIPSNILIVGAGYIGCEFSFIFRGLGAEVIIVDTLPRPLLGHDQEIIALIEKEFKRKGITLYSGSTIKSLQTNTHNKMKAVLATGEEIATEKVIICIGREPYTEGLDLEQIGVKTGRRGEIMVNEMMESTVSGIYAAGDVVGGSMLTSVARMEATIAAENALGDKRKIEYQFMPLSVYTNPEFAAVGMTEEETKKRGIPFLVGRCNLRELLKACSLDEQTGFFKLIFDHDSHRILGAHIIGLDATEVIHVLALAMKMEVRAEDLMDLVYNHPTISEGIERATRDALRRKQ